MEPRPQRQADECRRDVEQEPLPRAEEEPNQPDPRQDKGAVAVLDRQGGIHGPAGLQGIPEASEVVDTEEEQGQPESAKPQADHPAGAPRSSSVSSCQHQVQDKERREQDGRDVRQDGQTEQKPGQESTVPL